MTRTQQLVVGAIIVIAVVVVGYVAVSNGGVETPAPQIESPVAPTQDGTDVGPIDGPTEYPIGVVIGCVYEGDAPQSDEVIVVDGVGSCTTEDDGCCKIEVGSTGTYQVTHTRANTTSTCAATVTNTSDGECVFKY